MAEIRSKSPSISQHGQELRKAEQEIREMIKDIGKDRNKATQLRHLNLKQLSPANRSLLSQMLAQQLRGQIPPKLAAQLNQGDGDPGLLSQLTTRLANSVTKDPAQRAGRAVTPQDARASASNPNLPQQALRWAQFVQRPTNVGQGGINSRAGSASPKGAQTILAELIASSLVGGEGPGLRNPKLVGKALQNLPPEQQALLMEATFGKELAGKLKKLGISDPIMFVKAGALPTDRAKLAEALGISRGVLLGLLMRTELLKIGPGRGGEMAMRPDLLSALKDTGIAMWATLAALRGLSFDELKRLYKELRKRAGGFKAALKNGRVPVKRDLLHWARSAARRKSDILLADSEEHQGSLSRGDAEELVQAWYLENLLWWELERSRLRSQQDQERQRRQDDAEDDEEAAWADDPMNDMEYDDERQDHLMCFWITDETHDPQNPGRRHMYVCVDPDTGAIIPQYVEKEPPSR